MAKDEEAGVPTGQSTSTATRKIELHPAFYVS